MPSWTRLQNRLAFGAAIAAGPGIALADPIVIDGHRTEPVVLQWDGSYRFEGSISTRY